MAEKDANPINHNYQMIRDPVLMKSRIFVGNLPSCTREELESICHPYGNVLGSMVQKNFGFVQFESEELANKVASSLTKSTFKGNVITVRNAGAKQQTTMKHAPGDPTVSLGNNQQIATSNDNNNQASNSQNDAISDYNDCEIIVVDRRNTKYAEYIEDRLRHIQLRVDVLFPKSDVPLGKVLANISSRGCLYAVLVTTQHQEHNSITVNILHGQAAEHRNMPVDDAIQLIADDYLKASQARALNKNVGISNVLLPKPVPIIPAATMVAPTMKERHPDSIQILLNLLANNMPMTVLQYDHIIKYLQSCRQVQMKAELGDVPIITMGPPDPEIELQKKIIGILNKPSVTSHQILYPSFQSVREDNGVLNLLKDIRVQKALDSLMNSNLVATVEKYMKF